MPEPKPGLLDRLASHECRLHVLALDGHATDRFRPVEDVDVLTSAVTDGDFALAGEFVAELLPG